MSTEPAIIRAWEHLDGSVRTGEVAFDAVSGTDPFSHLAQRPDLSAEFSAAMSQDAVETAAVLPYAYDFGRFTSVTRCRRGRQNPHRRCAQCVAGTHRRRLRP